MEHMDFSGASDILQKIPDEKKVDEPQMMEFSSSIADIFPESGPQLQQQPVYTNPSNDKVSGLAISDTAPTPSTRNKKGNPFNLTDEQFNALIAGFVAVFVFSSSVQTKLAGTVPNFAGINGSIASVLVAAILFFLVNRFIKNR
jgi:hypothetical protein